MKICSKCKIEQPLTEFHIYRSGPRKGKIWAHCKQCRYRILREWRKENPEDYKRHYKQARFRHNYGLELHEIKEFGECPICLQNKRLVVDHDHTGPKRTYRGFICYSCNTLLGSIENPEKMARVYAYLQK